MTVDEIIKRYDLRRIDNDRFVCKNSLLLKKENARDELIAKKAEIKARLNELAEKEKLKCEDRMARINAIEGLDEIQSAIIDLKNWHYEFEKSFDDVGGLGVRKKPEYDFEAMYKKYTRAAAYLKAEKMADKDNYELSAIGRKALDRIIYEPDNYDKVIEEMEREVNQFVEKHMFD